MVRFALGVVAALVAFGLGGLAIVNFGLFDARASTPHSPWFAWATHSTMINRSKREAGKAAAPARFTPAEMRAGFVLYDHDCAMCHGGPGLGRARFVQGMNPSPPYLLGVARTWSPSRLHWIIGNGVKMTGMPAWNAAYTDGQVWDTVAFLEALPYLSPADYQRMKQQSAGKGGGG